MRICEYDVCLKSEKSELSILRTLNKGCLQECRAISINPYSSRNVGRIFVKIIVVNIRAHLPPYTTDSKPAFDILSVVTQLRLQHTLKNYDKFSLVTWWRTEAYC